MATQEDKELFLQVKEALKPEVTAVTYGTWIQTLNIQSIDNDKIIIIAQNPFQKDIVSKKYLKIIKETFDLVTQKNREVIVKLENEIADNGQNGINEQLTYNLNNGLNPKLTFDTFVVGNNNSFAQAAALGVAENPGSQYNPLFIYGGVGLGKTHLMHAIGNYILQNNPETKVLYVTSESFTNELINSLKDQKTEDFRQKYRNVDVLLIDDIQFIAGKKSTQEEFFNTFNSLHNDKKQIVLSSDRPPKDIAELDSRIKGRFEWGITTDISKPEYETRLAILRQKAQMNNIIIEPDILENIAEKVDTNVRELEGILNKLTAKASLTNSPITMEMSDEAIDSVIKSKEKVISPEYIQEVISKYFGVNKDDLVGQKRSQQITFPRQIAMYFCSNFTQLSTIQIGKSFGGRDHSTVMHSIDKIEKDLKDNPNTKLIVESVEKILLSKN